MLINLRNAMMAGKRLPYDAEVEYLESTGTQWIDTGVPLKFPISAEMTLAMISPYGTLDSLPVFGFRYGGGAAHSKFAIWFSKSNLRFALNYGPYDSSWKGSTVRSGQQVHLRTDGAKLYIDGSLVADGGTVTTSDASNTLTLFQMRDNSSVANRGQCVRYYSCKIYDANGVLVRDFIPVRKGTVGYLYDRVSGKLFGNAGTGDFVLGPDVVPVEWLESDGYSYIRTNILPSAGLRTKLRWAFVRNPIAQNSSVFGSRSSGTSTDRYWLNYDGHFEFGYGNYHATNVTVTPYEVFDVDFNYIDDGDHKFKINNSAFTASGTPNTSVAIPLFGRIVDTTPSRQASRGYYAEFIRDGVDVGKFLPVRVGTDATSWAGAMIDTLTRRIYRNAGTGAFTYGNDLKYPIPAE